VPQRVVPVVAIRPAEQLVDAGEVIGLDPMVLQDLVQQLMGEDDRNGNVSRGYFSGRGL
jgi:hypothetical protein